MGSTPAGCRLLNIKPTLAKWLAPYRHAKGRIAPSKWREHFRNARTAAGITEWPTDCLRHSFATDWLQVHRDAPALALEMGNSVEVIMERYSKVLDEPADAVKFWAIGPAEDGEKVVAFPSVAA